ncbi:MAG: SHOCT domain-containing protein [Candidatus Sungbacteria bacterium]|nr:SHOCT domain-containing protein [Candidatus Sungbacteria bacterium]
MKRFILAIVIATAAGLFVQSAGAQMMGARLSDGQGFSTTSVDWNEVVEHTAREEQEGKELWNKLSAKEVDCADLNDEQFGVLGEYFMGVMMGGSHAAMNAMMIQTHGEEGEEQIHAVMGKRLSGCDTSATVPGVSGGWTPMMNMMFPLHQGFGEQGGGWSLLFGNNSTNSMMNFGFGSFGFLGWIFMLLWWVLIIAGIVALVKWLTNQFHGTRGQERSALEILKERYAKGEIDKKEFEEKSREIKNL